MCGERERRVVTYQRKEIKNDAGNIKKLVDNEERRRRERTLIYEEIFKKLDTEYMHGHVHTKNGRHV